MCWWVLVRVLHTARWPGRTSMQRNISGAETCCLVNQAGSEWHNKFNLVSTTFGFPGNKFNYQGGMHLHTWNSTERACWPCLDFVILQSTLDHSTFYLQLRLLSTVRSQSKCRSTTCDLTSVGFSIGSAGRGLQQSKQPYHCGLSSISSNAFLRKT